MKTNDTRRLYLPAFVILIAVFIMLILIGLSTFRNIDRQKNISRDLVHQEGLTILQALEVGVLSHIAMHRLGLDAVEYLTREIPRLNDAIAYIYLLDADGQIVHESIANYQPDTADTWARLQASEHAVATRMLRRPDGTAIYEIARRIEVSNAAPGGAESNRQAGLIDDVHHQHNASVIGIEMTILDKAHRDDIHHALFMLVIVFALGASAVYFIYVIHKYYKTNRVLEETQAYSRQVVASLANGLLSIDASGRIVSYNQQALDLLGTAEDQMANAPLSLFVDFEKVRVNDTLNDGLPILEREILYHTGKQSIPLAISVTPIRMDGARLHGAVIMLRDLREIKALEAQMRQAEKLAAVGKLAASVAHEIRNPLSSIKGFAKYLHQRLGRMGEESRYTNVIVQEVDRINTVVNDLLTLARPSSIRKTPVNATTLVHHVAMLVEPDTQTKNIRIEVRVAEAEEMIEADSNQLTQALLNLLLNAVHAVVRDGVITLGLDRNRKPGYDCIWVRDDGAGISPENLQRIFDPFFTTHQSGTGLGLAIVHQIVENHQGIICVESPPGEEEHGSQFSIYLPKQQHIVNAEETVHC